MRVRLLNAGDLDAYRALRLEMLNDSPWAYGSSPGDDIVEHPGMLESNAAQDGQAIVLIEDPTGALVCAAGVMRKQRVKFRHRAMIWGVYTTPKARGKGCARSAMEHAMGIARSWDGIRHLDIGVSSNAPEALALYESLGFVRWGREPGAVCIDGVEYDELYLSMRV